MKKIVLALSLFLSSSAFADLEGTYTGCGQFSANGKQQVYFHLVKTPTGFGPNEFIHTAGFVWTKGGVATFFPEVFLNADQSQMLMRVDIQPRKDYGLIVKVLAVRVISENTLEGEYISNSAIPGEFASHGTWSATKVAPTQKMPTLNCN